MDIITATTTATSTIYRLTDNGMDLINFLIQLLVFSVALLAGLIMLKIVILIFKY
jgi:hypothetical protein